MNFNAFVEDIEKNQWNVYGVEVYVDGKLLHQYGDTTEHRHEIFSATKTITSWLQYQRKVGTKVLYSARG